MNQIKDFYNNSSWDTLSTRSIYGNLCNYGRVHSRKTIFRTPSKALRVSVREEPLPSPRPALDGVLKIVLREVWVAIRVLGEKNLNIGYNEFIAAKPPNRGFKKPSKKYLQTFKQFYPTIVGKSSNQNFREI